MNYLKEGQKIAFTGDAENIPGEGYIVRVRPPDRWQAVSYDVMLYDGREFLGVTPMSFGTGYGGHRFEVM